MWWGWIRRCTGEKMVKPDARCEMILNKKKEHRSVLNSTRTELMQAPLPLKTSRVFVRCKNYIMCKKWCQSFFNTESYVVPLLKRWNRHVPADPRGFLIPGMDPQLDTTLRLYGAGGKNSRFGIEYILYYYGKRYIFRRTHEAIYSIHNRADKNDLHLVCIQRGLADAIWWYRNGGCRHTYRIRRKIIWKSQLQGSDVPDFRWQSS